MTTTLRSRSFTVQKSGNAESENEDALEVSDDLGRYVVADGSTEGTYSRAWAIQLVKQYSENPLVGESVQSRRDWLPRFESPSDAAKEGEEAPERPWYIDRGRERGSYATLLGVNFQLPSAEDEALAWEAVAVGDSCLFVIEGGKLLESFPLRAGYDFHDAPQLLSTISAANDLVWPKFVGTRGVLRVGGLLLLATDALAAWVFEQAASDWSAIERVIGLADQGGFRDFVDLERDSHRMKNDDCSLVIVEALLHSRS